MAGNVRLEFAQFGDFDSFSIYRSESPMTVSALPTPILTGLKTMYAVDETTVDGILYYYRVGVIRGGETLVSEEVGILASSKYKWWRIANIVNRLHVAPEYGFSIAELNFINEDGVLNNNPTKAFSNSAYSNMEEYKAKSAFDGNPNTFAASNEQPYLDKPFFIIGYQFDTPVRVTSISLQCRPDMDISFGQEWQTADIEVSNDGLTWVKYGAIEPMVAALDKSVITVPII